MHWLCWTIIIMEKYHQGLLESFGSYICWSLMPGRRFAFWLFSQPECSVICLVSEEVARIVRLCSNVRGEGQLSSRMALFHFCIQSSVSFTWSYGLGLKRMQIQLMARHLASDCQADTLVATGSSKVSLLASVLTLLHSVVTSSLIFNFMFSLF